MNKPISIGADHAGVQMKNAVLAHLDEQGIKYIDFGVHGTGKADYPDIAKAVCTAIQKGESELGLLFCGTGIGMSMAANKLRGIRACSCSESFSTKYTRLHNDANVLCLGGRVIGEGAACELVDIFLSTQFEGGRHAARVNKITALENN